MPKRKKKYFVKNIPEYVCRRSTSNRRRTGPIVFGRSGLDPALTDLDPALIRSRNRPRYGVDRSGQGTEYVDRRSTNRSYCHDHDGGPGVVAKALSGL